MHPILNSFESRLCTITCNSFLVYVVEMSWVDRIHGPASSPPLLPPPGYICREGQVLLRYSDPISSGYQAVKRNGERCGITMRQEHLDEVGTRIWKFPSASGVPTYPSNRLGRICGTQGRTARQVEFYRRSLWREQIPCLWFISSVEKIRLLMLLSKLRGVQLVGNVS